MRAAAWFVLALAGCAPDLGEVEVQGVVRDGIEGGGLAGVTVRALGPLLDEVDRTTSGEQGWFRMTVPAQDTVHVELSGDGLRPSTFTGRAGSNPRLRVPNGASVAFTDAVWDDVLQTWDGCPGLGQGGTILGTIEVADVAEESGEAVLVSSGEVRVETEIGGLRAACYLGEDGLYAPDATKTGDAASFIVTNVPEGQHRLNVSWNPIPTRTLTEDYTVWVTEGGVAPRFPLLVESPIQLDF